MDSIIMAIVLRQIYVQAVEYSGFQLTWNRHYRQKKLNLVLR